MMGSPPGHFPSSRRSQPPPRKTLSSRPPRSLPPSGPAAVSRGDTSVLVTAEQLLRERPGARSEAPRSLSNEALMASLRPPAHYGSSRPLRRSMEPHLLDGLSWFLDRSPLQRVLLSTGLGAVVGVGIVVTLARLVMPDHGEPAAALAPATSNLAALAAPAAATLIDPPAPAAMAAPEPAVPVSPVVAAPAVADAPAEPVASLADSAEAADAKPLTGKAARKAKAAKRSKKAKQQRARKTSALPARWSELYARER
jgi:hypothetical protein